MCQLLGVVVMQHVGGAVICEQSRMYVCLVDTVVLSGAYPAPCDGGFITADVVRLAASWHATADRTSITL